MPPCLQKFMLQGDFMLRDQISKLPDEILASILSRLPLWEAVGTSILSSRWRHLWTLVTRLNFDRMKTYERIRWNPELLKIERHNFVKWVNQALALHEAGTIEEFKVCFSLDKRFKFDVDQWIKFALSRKVQKLELDLSLIFEGKKVYSFPLELLCQSEVTHMSSRFGIMFPHTRGCFKYLKELCLKYLFLDDEVVEFLLSNCSVLERLSIHRSVSLVNLKVNSSHVLKYLEIKGCFRIKSIMICNTNLVSFNYIGPRMELLLKNVPSLVNVCLDGDMTNNDIFAQISGVKILKLHFIDSWSIPNPRFLPKLTALKQLIVDITSCNDFPRLDYAILINLSPFLQKFVLKAQWCSSVDFTNREVMEYEYRPHLCLKEVKFSGYSGSKSDLGLVLYMFENAVALQKIIIDPRDQSRFSKKNYGTKRLRTARSRARQQLEGKAPNGVKLVII